MKDYRVGLFCFAVALVLTLSLAPGPLSAHHGRGQTYDGDQELSVAGTVSEFSWRNPHVTLFLDAVDESGNVVGWGFESSNVSTMSREGWSRNIFKPGQEVSVTYNPARSGAPVGILRNVTLSDGTIVSSRGNANTID
jgi:hypothetical protein